jgi:hypothetical protein
VRENESEGVLTLYFVLEAPYKPHLKALNSDLVYPYSDVGWTQISTSGRE